MSIASEIQRIKTNIANAYTAANGKGATLPVNQNSENLSNTIASIPSGGTTAVEKKDVNFIDYDGTLLHSYTLAELQELTELPGLPEQDGLICQGWNWNLANLKALNRAHTVGAVYITDDGKTRLYINIPTDGRMTIPLCFRQTVANGVEVDWGDGSQIETFSGSGSANILPTHQYSSSGNYIIKLNPLNDCILMLGANNSSYCIMGAWSNTVQHYANMLKKIEIGKNVTNIGDNAFQRCYSLSSITIPNTVTTINNSMFAYCRLLRTVIIPNGVISISSYAFQYCYSLSSITIPNSVTSIAGNTFQNCESLSNIIIPNSITSINFSTFYSCYSLSSITIPNTVTIINNNALYFCYCLTIITIPNSVSSIGSHAFDQCYGVKKYDFSIHTSIPTLDSSNAFNGIASDCQIIVPDDLYEDWIAAQNWSNYVSYIVKVSEV